MSTSREAFEKTFPIPAHWIEFNEKSNEYYCPYVADTKAFEYQSKWVVWQHQQKRIDEVIKWVEDNKKSIPLSEWHGYTTEEYVDADDLLDILKIEQELEGGEV